MIELKQKMIEAGAKHQQDGSTVLSSGEGGLWECIMSLSPTGERIRVYSYSEQSLVEINKEGAEAILSGWPESWSTIEEICGDANDDIGRYEIVKVIRKG